MFPINGLNPPLYGLTETKGSGLSSKRPSRTSSWLSAYVKWGRRILRRATGPAHYVLPTACRDLLYVCPKINVTSK